MKLKLRLLTGFCVFICTAMIHAQSTVPAAGGEATGSGGKVSYTVGQVAYTVITETTGSVLQGVQQPYEISVLTGIGLNDINLSCTVYPNPARDLLTLKIGNYETEHLSYKLLDINGIVLEDKKATANETEIIITNLVPAIYFLKVYDRQKEIKTFKIIKN